MNRSSEIKKLGSLRDDRSSVFHPKQNLVTLLELEDIPD
jgi:hypothetical protein